jgi:hypothetical protein
MTRQQRGSASALEYWMNGKQFAILIDTNLMGQTVHFQRASTRAVRHAIVVSANRHEALVAYTPLEPD